MDREIPKEVRNKERNKKIIRYSSIGVAGIVVIGILISVMRTGVEKKDLVLSTVDKGMIEVSVSASGKVVPAFEEIINSPINSRIVEVYRKGGDSVEIGTPILKLDLQSTETEYKKLLDEEQMRRYKLDQLRVNNQTKLSDMAMQIKVSAMKLSRMKVELRNEHYLDSLGAGTTDKVRQAELSYNVAQLEYEQLQQQYKNEKEVAAAELKVQELDFNIFRKSLAEMKRTLDDAQIRSPRKAILTYINNQIGAQISQGGQVAIISDLSHFKVEGEIADTYGDRVAAGGKAVHLHGQGIFAGMDSGGHIKFRRGKGILGVADVNAVAPDGGGTVGTVQAQVAACPVFRQGKIALILPDGVIVLRNLAGVQLFVAVPRVLGVDIMGRAIGMAGLLQALHLDEAGHSQGIPIRKGCSQVLRIAESPFAVQADSQGHFRACLVRKMGMERQAVLLKNFWVGQKGRGNGIVQRHKCHLAAFSAFIITQDIITPRENAGFAERPHRGHNTSRA